MLKIEVLTKFEVLIYKTIKERSCTIDWRTETIHIKSVEIIC